MRRGSSRLFWTFTLTFWFVVTFRRGPGNWLLIAITWKKNEPNLSYALSEFCIYSLQTHAAQIFLLSCSKNMWENRVQDCILEMDHKRWFLHKPLGKKYFGHAPPKPNKRSREREREREREKSFFNSDCKNSRTHITTNKISLATVDCRFYFQSSAAFTNPLGQRNHGRSDHESTTRSCDANCSLGEEK